VLCLVFTYTERAQYAMCARACELLPTEKKDCVSIEKMLACPGTAPRVPAHFVTLFDGDGDGLWPVEYSRHPPVFWQFINPLQP
jgi:hypothetical protein